jgi:arylsulfatase
MVAWPAKIKPQKEVRHQYVHAVDVVPTIYELLGIQPPDVIKGYPQNPIEGESFAASLTDPKVPGKETQFYAMLGQRSIYHEGWLACSLHPPISGWGNFDKDVWELYHLDADRAQAKNLAGQEPGRLGELQQLWFYYAGIYNGLPLDDRSALEQILSDRPKPGPDRPQYTYYPDAADVPEVAGVQIVGRSYTIATGVSVESTDAEGVLFAHGGMMGGHSLYVKDHRLHYAFNWVGTHLQHIAADKDNTTGSHVFTAEFVATGPNDDPEMPGFKGTVTLYSDDQAVGSDAIVTQPGPFCEVGEGICVGRDSASAVTPDYTAPFRFTGGTIDKVVVDVSGEKYVDHEAQVRGWFIKD